MKNRITLVLVNILFVFNLNMLIAQKIEPNIHKILFLGNSITYAGNYITDMETYLFIKYPQRNIEFINLGLPSETVSGLSESGHAGGRFLRPDLHERLSRILEKIHPDLIFACYGMNDGIMMPFNIERFEKYQDGIVWLHDTLEKATGARVIMITPPIYDTLKGSQKFYNIVLDNYSKWLLNQRKKSGWEVVDIHFPMKKYLEAHRKIDKKFHMQGFALSDDGVHPNEAGHWLIAKQLLSYLGEKEAIRSSDIKVSISHSKNAIEIFKLIGERQNTMKDAWLSFTGHKRPDMKIGLSIQEAKKHYSDIEGKLQELVK